MRKSVCMAYKIQILTWIYSIIFGAVSTKKHVVIQSKYSIYSLFLYTCKNSPEHILIFKFGFSFNTSIVDKSGIFTGFNKCASFDYILHGLWIYGKISMEYGARPPFKK